MTVRHRLQEFAGAIGRSLHTLDLYFHNCEYTHSRIYVNDRRDEEAPGAVRN